MTSKPYRYILLALLTLMSAQVSAADEIARRGALTFTSDDFMAHHFMTPPSKVEALRGNPRESSEMRQRDGAPPCHSISHSLSL